MWFVYALWNETEEKLYIGQTSNMTKRLEEHNQKRGNHYTAKVSGEWEIIYKEEIGTKREALIKERQLKSFKGREFVKQFIVKD